ncbi:MAG: hypothetical protein P8180_11280 [Gammaproteobacteria bacterium]
MISTANAHTRLFHVAELGLIVKQVIPCPVAVGNRNPVQGATQIQLIAPWLEFRHFGRDAHRRFTQRTDVPLNCRRSRRRGRGIALTPAHEIVQLGRQRVVDQALFDLVSSEIETTGQHEADRTPQ